MISLFEHQKKAISQLKTGSILYGGVGSGKSLTALAYFYSKECGGNMDEWPFKEMPNPKDLYIITTANKRDKLDWEREAASFPFSSLRAASLSHIQMVVDSWNNIGKYVKITNAFFIFDEQRVVGSGAWVKSFLKITKHNNWILLSATPGDTWMDYIPVFVANGFYKNRTDFISTHVVYKSFRKFPIVDHYVERRRLFENRKNIMVTMSYQKPTVNNSKVIYVPYDVEKYNIIKNKRWNVFTDKPIQEISEYCYALRRVVNTDPNRLEKVRELAKEHKKVIVFYNFNYELEILRTLKDDGFEVAEYNGHKHEEIPIADNWIYLVQDTSGSEGWNCIETNTIIFYSQNYSYRLMTQAAGRIDRLNSPFIDLYYYVFVSKSPMDLAIAKALMAKENFNVNKFETWKK